MINNSTQNFYILGKGSYAVVISPAIMLNPDVRWDIEYKDVSEKDVSKIYTYSDDNENYCNELDMLKVIMEIEDYTRFTVPVKGAVIFKKSDIHKESINCQKVINIKHSTMFQIIFGYGGLPLNNDIHSFTFQEAKCFLIQFFKGIQSIHSKNIVHRDVKPTNILINGDKLKIIDFGLSCHVEDVFNYVKSDFTLSNIYPFNPPEFYVFFLLKKYNIQNIKDIDALFSNLLDNKSSVYKEIHMYYLKHWCSVNSDKNRFFLEYLDGFKRIIFSLKYYKNIADFFSLSIAYKCDIYASSYIIFYLLKKVDKITDDEYMYLKNLYNLTCKFHPNERINLQNILFYLGTK